MADGLFWYAVRELAGTPSEAWMESVWAEVAKAVKRRDRQGVEMALRVIYDIAPDASIRAMADDFLSGRRR